MLTRRRLLTGSAAGLLTGCATRRAGTVPPAAPRSQARVIVTRERTIRTIVGLRPFRPSGFVVRAEKLDGKVLVHNYGHGGAGITLSWGTAQLAVDAAGPANGRPCAVIGCGVVGLSTARLMQLRGASVTIYTRAMPPATTSNVAGGLWEPVSVYDHERVTPAFRRQFGDAAQFAWRRYQSLAGDYYGVRWMPLFSLSNDSAHTPPPPESALSEVEPLYPESRNLARTEHPFPVPYAHRRLTMLIEPAIYLNSLIRDFQIAGGRIAIRDFASPREVAALPEDLIFNCTGLGARELFGDSELTPIRGQLVFLVPQPEIDYCTVGPSGYMFPRHDGIVLGGSWGIGDYNLEPDPAITERILHDQAQIFGSMRT